MDLGKRGEFMVMSVCFTFASQSPLPPVSYTFHSALCSGRLTCTEFINDLLSKIAHKIHDTELIFEFQINNKILVCPIKYLGSMKNSLVVNLKLEFTYVPRTFNLLSWVTLLPSFLVYG